jgi:hypothetical protein
MSPGQVLFLQTNSFQCIDDKKASYEVFFILSSIKKMELPEKRI